MYLQRDREIEELKATNVLQHKSSQTRLVLKLILHSFIDYLSILQEQNRDFDGLSAPSAQFSRNLEGVKVLKASTQIFPDIKNR